MNFPITNLLLSAIFIFSFIEANIRIGVTTDSRYVGEREVAWRIKIAGEQLGWTVLVDENEGQEIQHLKDLEYVICLLPRNVFLNPHCPNYLTIFHPFDFFDKEQVLLPLYEKYDGYLLTIDAQKNSKIFRRLNYKEVYTIPFYPSIYAIDYKEPAPSALVTMIAVWSNRFYDEKFKKLYALLSQTCLVKFYGINKH